VDEALAAIETAMRFNPAGRGAGNVFDHATALYLLQRYPESVAIADAGIARYPNAPYLHAMRAASLAQMGKAEEAREAAAQLKRADPFFRSAQFGDRFVDPKHMAHIQEGLRKAGL
jgi:adenylate cyclase